MKFLKGVVHLCGSVYRHRAFDRLYSVRRLCIASQKLAWWQIKGQSVHHTEALRKGEQKQDMEGGQQEPPETSVDDTDDQSKKKPQFGTRFLTDPKNVFQHNAWDNVVWDNQQEAEARQKTEEQLQDALSPEQQELYEKEADLYWDKFYDQHQNRFFKDRHWLFTEFPELYSSKGNTLKPSTAELSKNDENKSEGTLAASAVTNQRCNANSKEQGDHTNDKRIPCTSVGSISSTASVVTSISDCSAEDVQQDPNATDCAAGDAVTSNSADDGEKLEPPKIQHIEKKAGCDCVCSSTSESFPGESASFRILEVGCGVGNTVFPVLSTNNDPGLMVYCCDFSSTAVQLVKENRDYDPKRCHAFVWDITDEKSVLPFPPESLDIVIMIFVLSAIHPDKMQQAVDRLASCLKPGGMILLRDYGRYDMAQLRFKKGRCLAENFYVRGDGTRVYFFTQEEFRSMFQKAGLEEVQNLIDRRLQVNRGRQLKMYRVWIQCKYWKPLKGRQFVDNSDKASTAPLS